MIQFKSQWVSSGKIHKKTQAEIGFFRGVIDSGAVVRCTLQRFSNGKMQDCMPWRWCSGHVGSSGYQTGAEGC